MASGLSTQALEAGREQAPFDRWVNHFLPQSMLNDFELRRRARMFVAVHSFAPFAGLAMLLEVYRLDPDPGLHLLIPTLCMAGFWAFLPALRRTGNFTLLALLSVQNLAFIVLFTSYHYGGINSPFLPWILVTPLLAFFYLGGVAGLTHLAATALALETGLFMLLCRLAGAPVHVPPDDFGNIGTLSLWFAGLLVTAAAVHCANLLESRSALECEVQRRIVEAHELRAARDAAEAASRAKTDFLASMSHELRTPLNAVIGFSELMVRDTFGPIENERYRGYVRDIHASGAHLLEIINDVLDVAKAESGNFELLEETFDCRESIADAAKMLRHRISEAGLQLEMDLPHSMPRLRADRRRIRQVFLNLLTNAVKFTPPGGKVSISAACDENRGLAVTVRDTGIGIARENLKKVLEPFVQVGGAARRKLEGTGLGLPLVDVMMQRHGGRLELDSEPGKSTTARVIFPLERLAGFDDAPDAAKHVAAGGTRGATVLVVDDDDNFRNLIARLLSRGGYRTVTATDGIAALKCLRSQAIDLVVTDMLMPEMDGTELLRALRLTRPGLPVIAISGAVEWKDRLCIVEDAGACATLSKPIAAAQLLRAVKQSLNEPPVGAAA